MASPHKPAANAHRAVRVSKKKKEAKRIKKEAMKEIEGMLIEASCLEEAAEREEKEVERKREKAKELRMGIEEQKGKELNREMQEIKMDG